MKNLVISILILLTLAVGGARADMYVTMHSNGGGSPYYATVTSDSDVILGLYHAGDSFNTFCLEHSENFREGNKYRVTLDMKAYNGSVGPAGDPLDISTAWLYSYYLDHGFTGELAGYNANQVQNVVWTLEQESVPALTTTETQLMNKAITNGALWGNDFHGVMVMNLYGLINGDYTLAQSQVICGLVTPVPGAMLLGFIGLAIVGWAKRKLQ